MADPAGQPAPDPSTTKPQTEPNGGNFISEAKNFIKNPLGIIGLFIVLVYAVATIVIGTLLRTKLPAGTSGMDYTAWLICFVVLFPLVVLIVFFILVVYHHEKLYAPTDFLDPKDWLELQRLLADIDKQQEPLARALNVPTPELDRQKANIEKARVLVNKALSKALDAP